MQFVSGEIKSIASEPGAQESTGNSIPAPSQSSSSHSEEAAPVAKVAGAQGTPVAESGGERQDDESAASLASSASTEQATTTTTSSPAPYQAKWEKKWEADVTLADRRDLPKSIEEKLNVTAEMYSETPKADALREEIKLVKMDPGKSAFPTEALICVLLPISVGVSMAMRATQLDLLLALPLFVSFIILRVTLQTSLRTLNLVPKQKQYQVTSSATVNTIIKSLPPSLFNVISGGSRAFYLTKDSFADVCIFVVAYGLTKTLM